MEQGDIHAGCREEIQTLRKRIERLEWLLSRNSRNSSKPPSSDFPSAPPKQVKPPTGRKPGGQPGHEGHQRPLLSPEQVDQTVALKPDRCGKCRHALSGADPYPLRHQVTEVPPVRPHTTEYQRHRLICRRCGETTLAPLPEDIPEGMFGPRLQTITAYLSGKAHLSKRAIEEAMRDLFGVSISLGAIHAAEQIVSEALADPYEKAQAYVQESRVVHADETGWRQRRKLAWLWVAASPAVTVFLIHAKRGAVGAQALLGHFAGYLVSDRWHAYNGWDLWMRQICWAHLIRDFTGFTERGAGSARIGKALLAETKKMFRLWHRVRDGTLARSTFQSYMGPIRRRVERLILQGTCCTESKTEGMCKRILKMSPALWTFVRVEGVEPTNNAAERAVRPAVLYRKGCFGTHSPAGSRFVERILTAVTTLRQQKRNVLDYLTEACVAARAGKIVPSLLPALSAGRTAS